MDKLVTLILQYQKYETDHWTAACARTYLFGSFLIQLRAFYVDFKNKNKNPHCNKTATQKLLKRTEGKVDSSPRINVENIIQTLDQLSKS